MSEGHKRIALIGNPNSGKTTLFNQLTGAHQHIGNWPGVTVERKTGQISHKGLDITLVDLPGIYSLSPYTQEERIAEEYVLSDEVDGILNIVDAVHIERSLYLTLQLIALGLPMIVVLGFMDDASAQGMTIDCVKMSRRLGVPVVAVCARTGENMGGLRDALVWGMQPPVRQTTYLGGIGAAIRHTTAQIASLPLRPSSLPFYAEKLLEGDAAIWARLERRGMPRAMQHAVEKTASGMQQRADQADREMILADARYTYIEALVRDTCQLPQEQEETITERIDRILLHRIWALPIFALFMFVMFWCTFGPLGTWLENRMQYLIQGVLSSAIYGMLEAAQVSAWITSLVCDGIIGGVGSVLRFLPQILILFFFLSVLEDSGYLARVAFMMDALLRRIGLSGKSFVPMLMGFGCTTTAVMAARTMENEDDRRMTIMLTPYMSCAAKLPVFALVAGALFDKYEGLVVISLYILGIAMGAVAGFLLKATVFQGVSADFVLELPPYRMPRLRETVRNMWQRVTDFVTRAGTVILVMSVAIWLMQYFTPAMTVAQRADESVLAALGRTLALIFRPLGFDDWRLTVALLAGLAAKEAVVSTMRVLYGTGADGALLAGLLGSVLTPLAGYSFLVFTLLYMPCISAFATIRRELGGWGPAVGAAVLQTALAYLTALVIYQIGSLLI